MTLLDTTNRARVTAQWQRDNNLDPCSFTKAQLAAAVAATDQWIEDNTASYVAALPAAFRTNSTAAQKQALFSYVLMRRIGKLSAEEDG